MTARRRCATVVVALAIAAIGCAGGNDAPCNASLSGTWYSANGVTLALDGAGTATIQTPSSSSPKTGRWSFDGKYLLLSTSYNETSFEVRWDTTCAVFVLEGDLYNDFDINSDVPFRRGGTTCEATADRCSCAMGAPNSVKCGAGSVANSVCCADTTWPGSGRCICATVTCSSDGNGCSCRYPFASPPSLSDAPPEVACSGFKDCCLTSYGSCFCSNSACSASDRFVASCKPADYPATCSSGQKMVTSCN